MAEFRHWVDLSLEDRRNMLVALVGYRFGREPEARLDEIRAERADYMASFLRLAGIGPKDTVLELGSGCGFGTRVLAARAGRVLACDISPAFLSWAREELAGVDNVSFHQVASRDLSGIDDGSIDVVVSVSVFIHFNLYDMHGYFAEFARVLKPGGRVAFDFADERRLGGWLRLPAQQQQFLEHAAFYREDPRALAGLVQWNSAAGIRAVADMAGFRRQGRRGHRLLFRKR